MIKELQIRPFARPLLVWIAGIMLQTVFSCCTYSWVLLLLPVIILTTAGLALRGQEHFCYETRWLWGVVFLSLLLFLSIQKTACSQFEALSEHPGFPSFPLGAGRTATIIGADRKTKSDR